MPAGCQFICKNENCIHVGKGFNVSAPWPLDRIENVIELLKDADKEVLVKLKEEGHEAACVVYPHPDNQKTIGYRIQKWCDQCKCVWSYDLIFDTPEDTIETMLAKKPIELACKNCNNELLTFDEITERGILCPHCKEEMQQNRWMTRQN